ALIARYGPAWFRGCGTVDSPGSTLLTVSGAMTHPGVYEIGMGSTIGQALDAAGGPTGPVQAVLVGGYGGNWLPFPSAARLRMTHRDLATVGASLGVASLVVLPTGACGLAETARILRYLAGETAAQCGPCMFGLPAISEDFTQLVPGAPRGHDTLTRLRRRLEVIGGRGACGHPDGAVRLAGSALRAFPDDLRAHLAGRPCPGAGHPCLALPAWEDRCGDWR
ncbi:MAG: NADH-ubiquinone oxidoreductase-F iron-sulfur binding region domain-containing protein, partial [Sciscionella sp.]